MITFTYLEGLVVVILRRDSTYCGVGIECQPRVPILCADSSPHWTIHIYDLRSIPGPDTWSKYLSCINRVELFNIRSYNAARRTGDLDIDYGGLLIVDTYYIPESEFVPVRGKVWCEVKAENLISPKINGTSQ
jgi:hypothetical protein